MEGLTTVIRNNVEAAMAHVSVSITPSTLLQSTRQPDTNVT